MTKEKKKLVVYAKRRPVSKLVTNTNWNLISKIAYLETVVVSDCIGVLKMELSHLQKWVARYAQTAAHALAFCWDNVLIGYLGTGKTKDI